VNVSQLKLGSKKFDDDDNNNNNNNNVFFVVVRLVHLLIFRYISVPYHSQCQSTLHNHKSTHLILPVLLLCLSGRLMDVLYP